MLLLAHSPKQYAALGKLVAAAKDRTPSELYQEYQLLLAEAQGLAQSIADNGRLNTWLTKRGLWANLEAGSLAAALELENRTQILIRGTGSLEQRASERGFTKNG